MKPKIDDYLNLKTFLNAQMKYLKSVSRSNNLAALSVKSGLSTSFISLVISGARFPSEETLMLIAGAMEVPKTDWTALNRLRLVAEDKSLELRHQTLTQMVKSKRYQKSHPTEARTQRYLSHWYIVAIREMANDSNFKLDVEWIFERLNGQVKRSDIKDAVDFLVSEKFITVSSSGKIQVPNPELKCEEASLKLALASFHREMLKKAMNSIEEVSSENRQLMGYTLSFAKNQIPEVQHIFQEAIDKIKDLSKSADKSNSQEKEVFHVELTCFPLTHSLSKGKRS